jgi:UDP-N-acetylmuramate--alanine ligase
VSCGRNPGYLVGGVPAGALAAAAPGDGRLFVTEVDESDGTQAEMRSSHAILVNAEDDHCWSVGGEAALAGSFRTFTEASATVVAADTPGTRTVLADHRSYQLLGDADALTPDELPVPGRHNRLNAALAIRLATLLGVAEADARAAMRSFAGVERRMSVRHQGAATLLEDYAHHPTEVAAALTTIAEDFPGRRVHVVFEPHRHERVARYAREFARELSCAAQVWVVPTFGAWLNDGEADDARAIADMISSVAVYAPMPYPQLAQTVAAATQPDDVLVVMGAGAVTELVAPLTAELRARRL